MYEFVRDYKIMAWLEPRARASYHTFETYS